MVLEPIGWKSAGQIREIFKNSFVKFGFPYYNPHSFRETLSSLGKKNCTLEQYQAFKSKF